MTTRINNWQDMFDVLNDNLEELLTEKREPQKAQVVVNSVGTFQRGINMILKYRGQTGNGSRIEWFETKEPQITNGETGKVKLPKKPVKAKKLKKAV